MYIQLFDLLNLVLLLIQCIGIYTLLRVQNVNFRLTQAMINPAPPLLHPAPSLLHPGQAESLFPRHNGVLVKQRFQVLPQSEPDVIYIIQNFGDIFLNL